MTTDTTTGMRVRPTALAGLGVFLLYLALIVLVQSTSGVDYDDLAASSQNIWRFGILSLGVGALAVTALTVWFGWWRAATVETVRSRKRWTLVAPAIYLAVALGNLVVTDWGALEIGFVLSAVVLGVTVGFAEELTTRGTLLVGLRGTMREIAVWATTCVLFGAMHGLNIVFGAEVGSTLQQVVVAGMQGSAFYVLRRVLGRLAWAMALHGLWDFSIFTQSAAPGGDNVLGLLVLPTALLSVVAGFVVARDAGRRSAGEPHEAAKP
ncbi:CPBP family intramembrane glutamic endopeptidase [Isoptericola haloaureus]|uniref:CPBP family intramembrane glutamic endopeptidase n=1 Tax=Isoptericola haloaureus TaxID=1542902 RepID=A0ABU7Z7F3_9MICO